MKAEEPCHHKPRWTSPCQIYQICDKCGATRKRIADKPGEFDKWHSCDLCVTQHKWRTR